MTWALCEQVSKGVVGSSRASPYMGPVNLFTLAPNRPASVSCECDSHSPQSQFGHCVLGRPRRKHRHWLLHFPASTNHPSAPLACVLGTLSPPPVTPTGDQSSPPRGGGIWELVSPGSSCPCHPTAWRAWMFESWDWCETALLSHHLPAATEWPWAACDPGGEHHHQGLCPLGTG